jgi:hypothetical protein
MDLSRLEEGARKAQNMTNNRFEAGRHLCLTATRFSSGLGSCLRLRFLAAVVPESGSQPTHHNRSEDGVLPMDRKLYKEGTGV